MAAPGLTAAAAVVEGRPSRLAYLAVYSQPGAMCDVLPLVVGRERSPAQPATHSMSIWSSPASTALPAACNSSYYSPLDCSTLVCLQLRRVVLRGVSHSRAMTALTAMKSFKQRLGRDRGLTYELEVVAQHASERRRHTPVQRLQDACTLQARRRTFKHAILISTTQPSCHCRPGRAPRSCSSVGTASA